MQKPQGGSQDRHLAGVKPRRGGPAAGGRSKVLRWGLADTPGLRGRGRTPAPPLPPPASLGRTPRPPLQRKMALVRVVKVRVSAWGGKESDQEAEITEEEEREK